MKPDILVGTADGLHQVGDERSSALDGREVTALSRGESGWWALLDGSEAWRSGGDGKWSRLATLDGLKANCIVRSGQKVLVGTSEAHLYALKGEDLEPVEAFDNAPGRAAWHTPWGGPPDVRSLSADPDGKVYANVHVGGIARSSDGGGSWEPTIEISADVHEVLFDAGSGLLLAAGARGLSVSSDDGATWTLEGEGLHGGGTCGLWPWPTRRSWWARRRAPTRSAPPSIGSRSSPRGRSSGATASCRSGSQTTSTHLAWRPPAPGLPPARPMAWSFCHRTRVRAGTWSRTGCRASGASSSHDSCRKTHKLGPRRMSRPLRQQGL